jgi:predicted secreted protein
VRTLRWGVSAIVILAAALSFACKPAAEAKADAEADAKADAEADADAEAKADAEVEAAAPDASTAAATSATSTSTSTSATDGGKVDGGAKATVGLPGATVNLDEGSSGKTIELAKGQAVVLMLGATPSSGFDWAVMKAPAALGQPSLGFVAGADQMGAAGKRRIAWTVKETLPAGEHTVELGYARSFEPGVAPFKTFKFKVRAAH